MKNKTFKRLICFLLALVVMFSLPLDLQAEAVAIELGWMTWVLVSAMTAMGFSFVASGGIDALQSAVEDAVDEYDEYQKTIGHNRGLYENLDDKLLFGGGGGQGPNLGNRFWLTAAGVAAIGEFVQWVRDNLWTSGTDITSEYHAVYQTFLVNGEEQILQCSTLEETFDEFSYMKLDKIGYIAPFSGGDWWNYTGSTFVDIFNRDDLQISTGNDNFYDLLIRRYGDKDSISYLRPGLSNWSTINLSAFSNITSWSELLGVTTVTWKNSSGVWRMSYGIVDNSGYCYVLKAFTPINDPILLSEGFSISSPSEVIEYDVQENELLELDFSVFENQEFNSPEEMADAIKNNIIDTGTVPQITPEIIVDPSTLPPPTPAPTPVPSPEIEDIDDLGLPTLGEAIFNKFPFSLPKDLKRIADILNAEPVTPFWEVNLFETLGNRVPFVGDTTIRIDFAEYEALGQISRWASVITFVIFLVIITKGVIRW